MSTLQSRQVKRRAALDRRKACVKRVRSAPARGQNCCDELFRDIRGQSCFLVIERAPSEFHRLLIASEVLPAVDTLPQVEVELLARIRRHLAREVIHQEIGEFAAGQWVAPDWPLC